MTLFTLCATNREFNDDEPLPIGFPCRNTDVLILNEKNERCQTGEQGELCEALDQASDLDQGGCRQEGASKAEGEAQADAGWGVSDGTIPEARFCRSRSKYPMLGTMERRTRAALIAITILAALAGVLQLGVAFWARLEMMQAESPVALHSLMFSRTGQLYYDLNRYPFIHSPYMPLFYIVSAGLQRLGLSPLASGRALAACSVIGIIALTWNLLSLCTFTRYACWVGTLLVAVTADLWAYGTVGRVDVPGIMFSMAAFYQYARFRKSKLPGSLVWAGFWVLVAIFFKQTMIAAAGAIILSLALTDLKRAFWFAAAVGGVTAGCVFALDTFTSGRFLDNTVRANITPLNAALISSQFEYLALVGGSSIVIAALGARLGWRGREPLYAYLAAAAGVFVLTAGKVGADLNYQIELLLALGLCAGWALDRCDFFPRLFRGDPGPVTLLQLPLLLYVVVNLGIATKTIVVRIADQPIRRQELAALRPYLESARGPVISVADDPLLQTIGKVEIEAELDGAPKFKASQPDNELLSGAASLTKRGLSNPEPIRRDLENGAIPVVILYQDIFNERPVSKATSEARGGHRFLPTLPKEHLDAIRKRYRLVRHVPGPFAEGDFIYKPIEQAAQIDPRH
jgi:hypothetical protein